MNTACGFKIEDPTLFEIIDLKTLHFFPSTLLSERRCQGQLHFYERLILWKDCDRQVLEPTKWIEYLKLWLGFESSTVIERQDKMSSQQAAPSFIEDTLSSIFVTPSLIEYSLMHSPWNIWQVFLFDARTVPFLFTIRARSLSFGLNLGFLSARSKECDKKWP